MTPSDFGGSQEDVYFGSPMPPYGLSPAAYYYYYHNGTHPWLSHSYHDLSELQQQNMVNIMRRSGFAPEDFAQQPSTSKQYDQIVDVSESPVKSPPAARRQSTTGGGSWSAKYRQSKTSTSQDRSPERESPNRASTQLQVDDYPLERSVSMPAIPGSGFGGGTGGQDGPMMDQSLRTASKMADDMLNVISDEVIQELGMWEQVIQEERKDGGPEDHNQEDHEDYEIEDETDREESPMPQSQQAAVAQQQQQREQQRDQQQEFDYQEEMATQTPSPTQGEQQQQSIGEQIEEQLSQPLRPTARKQSIVPVVNIQQATPNRSADSENADRRSPVSDEDEIIQQKMPRRESLPKSQMITKQESLPQQQEQQQTSEEEGSSGEDVVTQVEVTQPTEEPTAPESTEQPESTQQAETGEPVDPKSAESKPKAESKGKAPGPNKTGIPGPPARRLSRIPQQLYIKTTPAIPMNANIQHILANVARTEGPFDVPSEAVKAAVIAMHDNAWTTKVEGMLAVVRLATFHPHYLIRDQHQIALHLVSETRNLRSTVSRSAIFTIGELFQKLKSQIEPEMDILVQALMYKVGENSVFIREDIDRALQLMIESMPQTRAALSLITYGSNHRNTYVRRTSAQFLSALVEKMGSMKCLLGPRDIGEHLLPAAARFIQDGNAHSRYFGRRIFAVLMQHPMFDKFLRRHVSPGTYRNICGMLETIKRRGVGDKPADLYMPTVQPKETDPRRLVVVGGENK